MHTLLIKLAPRTLVLATLFATCIVPAFADTKANFPAKAAVKKPETTTLKGHEMRMNGHLEWMKKAGKAHELSQEFLAVLEGMKKGNYTYDVETASKVLQELYASHKPIAPNGLKPRIETKTQN